MNFKRLPLVILMFVFLLNINVSAKTDEEVIKQVSDANIMTGTDVGFEGEKTLTRAQATTIVVRMKDMENEAVSEINYSDVEKDDWFYKYVSIATKAGITKGVGDNTFMPDREVTLGEAVTMFVRAISGDVETIEKSGSWPTNYMNYAKKHKLLDGITKKQNDIVERIDAARIIANILDQLDTKEEVKKTDESDVSRAAAGVIVSIAQMADGYNEIELAVPGKIAVLNAHNSELPQGVALPGTYVDFWLVPSESRMWDIETEQKVTDITENFHLAKVIKFSDGLVRFVRKPNDATKRITTNDTEYVDANTIIFLKCDEMKLEDLNRKDDAENELFLREFDDLKLGSEFDIELTEDYNDGLTYSEMDGTEVFYQSIRDKKDNEIIVSMIYAID